jgi:outer membrane protein TolC
MPPPATVSDPQPEADLFALSLDDAIRITLENSEVVRVLAGVTAVSSGRTIYDSAISNTVIDQEKDRFDPNLQIQNTFNHLESPQAAFAPLDPKRAQISGFQTDSYNLSTSLSKTMVHGGTASITFNDTYAHFEPGVFPLNPQNQGDLTLQFTQPLFQGAGAPANLAPIVIAGINVERSYFQFKAGMQDSVRGVIEAYWALVFARTDVLVREFQVEQGQEAVNLESARFRVGLSNIADVSQAKLALANFKAALVTAQANQIQREAALRNIMGLPPSDGKKLVPISPPNRLKMDINWEEIVQLAEERRPDLIELKLIIEADQQFLTQANNLALPKVDAVALYRWNGLEGRTPSGDYLASEPGQFNEWTLGVNFSLPLGLRRDRAVLRQQELILARDWANLDQGMHAAVHDLAASTRSLSQFYEQYQAFQDARAAALENLNKQQAERKTGRVILLNVLQAITDWGNAVSAEAQSLAQYNVELANLEQMTGTILETHGIYFFEERFRSIGPLGRLAHPKEYPLRTPPTPNVDRYPDLSAPAESIFDLKNPVQLKGKRP